MKARARYSTKHQFVLRIVYWNNCSPLCQPFTLTSDCSLLHNDNNDPLFTSTFLSISTSISADHLCERVTSISLNVSVGAAQHCWAHSWGAMLEQTKWWWTILMTSWRQPDQLIQLFQHGSVPLHKQTSQISLYIIHQKLYSLQAGRSGAYKLL